MVNKPCEDCGHTSSWDHECGYYNRDEYRLELDAYKQALGDLLKATSCETLNHYVYCCDMDPKATGYRCAWCKADALLGKPWERQNNVVR